MPYEWTTTELTILKENSSKLPLDDLAKLFPERTRSSVAHKRSRLGIKYLPEILPIPLSKVCVDCGIEKPIDDFHLHCLQPDGHHSDCKDCARARINQHYKDPGVKERKSAYNKEYQDSRPREYFREKANRGNRNRKKKDLRLYKLRFMLRSAKSRAKKKNLPFDISEAEFGGFRQLDYCPVFPHIELKWDNDKIMDNSPTIDRIIDELGYIRGNVRIISWLANRIKSNATAAEILLLAKDVENRIEYIW